MAYLFFWVTQLGQYGLGYAAVTAPGSSYKRHGHDKLGLVLGPNSHIIITLDALTRLRPMDNKSKVVTACHGLKIE